MRWPWQRRRFRELVTRQLAIFEEDHAELIEDARRELDAYAHEHDAAAAQERYGDHDSLASDVEDELDAIFRNWRDTLDPAAEAEYRREFARQARARYGDLLPRLRFDPPDDALPG